MASIKNQRLQMPLYSNLSLKMQPKVKRMKEKNDQLQSISQIKRMVKPSGVMHMISFKERN